VGNWVCLSELISTSTISNHDELAGKLMCLPWKLISECNLFCRCKDILDVNMIL
jgi:hypothetical protein